MKVERNVMRVRLEIKRHLAPTNLWHWAVFFENGHVWECSESFESAELCVADASGAGMDALHGAELAAQRVHNAPHEGPAAPFAAGPLDAVVGRLTLAQIGSCTCMTKTTESEYHGQECLYRLLHEAADTLYAARASVARWDAIETLMILGDVELKQAEDGGYSIYVEPVENIVPQSWEGDTPDHVADKVVAQLMTPNAKLTGATPEGGASG